MTEREHRPIAQIDGNGHLIVNPYRHPEDGLLTLVFHLDTTQAVAFLFRALGPRTDSR